MSKTAITSPELAPPVGPFSQAVKIDGFLFFSGQVAQDPATGKVVEGGIVAETERVLQNLSAVLTAAGVPAYDGAYPDLAVGVRERRGDGGYDRRRAVVRNHLDL